LYKLQLHSVKCFYYVGCFESYRGIPDERLKDLGPVSDQTNQNATIMGGWMLSIPESSANKDLAWELLTIMLEPEVLAPMLHDYCRNTRT
jgi:maltose-binding protein MalE